MLFSSIFKVVLSTYFYDTVFLLKGAHNLLREAPALKDNTTRNHRGRFFVEKTRQALPIIGRL